MTIDLGRCWLGPTKRPFSTIHKAENFAGYALQSQQHSIVMHVSWSERPTSHIVHDRSVKTKLAVESILLMARFFFSGGKGNPPTALPSSHRSSGAERSRD